MAYGDIDAGMTEAEKQHLAELTATCEAQSKELEWYRTLKIERHEGDNDDGGVKAQMLHEMWEENVRLRETANNIIQRLETLHDFCDATNKPLEFKPDADEVHGRIHRMILQLQAALGEGGE